MGCDIHLTVERKVYDKWICVNILHSHTNNKGWSLPVAANRNYERFSALAGVRGEGPKPLGLPDDISDTTKFLSFDYGIDGHSHSWMEIKEAAKLFVETNGGTMDSFDEKYPIYHFFGIEEDVCANADHRIVFWFDN